ncbi:hypothetical protein BGZ76_008694 [Entomortierella beljakovae]|nr:hypothetical protein BGZ76_008694 [Entomortierella beljakovae]
MSGYDSSSNSWTSFPRNINFHACDGDYADHGLQPITNFFSSSANSSPCSFISAISTIDESQNNGVLDEHELVHCSFTASRVTLGNYGPSSKLTDESSDLIIKQIKQRLTHTHSLFEQNWRQSQAQELVRDGSQRQPEPNDRKDHGHTPYQSTQNHIQTNRDCECDSNNHDSTQQRKDITPIHSTPFCAETSCLSCLSVPSKSRTFTPPIANTSYVGDNSTPIASSLPSVCMCSTSNLPRRRYRTVSSFSSLRITVGGNDNSSETNNAIIPSLALVCPMTIINQDNGKINNKNSDYYVDPVLQPSVTFTTSNSKPELSSLQQRSESIAGSSTTKPSGLISPYQRHSLQNYIQQQQGRSSYYSIDTKDQIEESIKNPTLNIIVEKEHIQYKSTTPSTNFDMEHPSSTPSSSGSTPSFHSPSSSINWESPQAYDRSSLITASLFSPFSEQGSQFQSKGKGVIRTNRLGRRGTIRAFDGLPREIKIHVFRYLSTFQLIRISRVNRTWRNLAMDGSLWKSIDVTRYYKAIKDDQLHKLGTSASAFLRYANFRGCVQLSGESLSAIAERCPNIERLNISGCRSVSSKSIADVCMNMPLLSHLDLSSLESVNNYTLITMAFYCRSLQVLNIAWCKQISGSGLVKLTRSCQELRKLNVSGCSNLEDRLMPVMGMNLPKLRELCLNGCSSLTDRGLIGLLSGLSVGSSKKHRRWRMKKRLSSSVRVSSLGHLLINQSSCNDDDNDDDDDDEDMEDGLDKDGHAKEEEESDHASDIDAEDGDLDGEGGNESNTGGHAQASTETANTNPKPSRSQDKLQARLAYLGLSQCRLLTHDALRAIGDLCGQHIRRLELSNCENFGDDGLVYLSQHCTRLQLLDLEDVNLLTDISLRSFAMNLPKLERLCLSYCENITDQGIMRMIRPASNPMALSTATAMMMNAETSSLYCGKLVHLELDNCLLITDRILLEFASVLEERAAAATECRKERERKREERRERIRQKKRNQLKQSRYSIEDDELNSRTSCDQTDIVLGQEALVTESNSMTSIAGTTFISSAPVNIPNRFRHMPAITGSLVSYSSSPLQPRSVLASTLLSEEVVIKKTRPGTRIMVPTRSSSTSSASCTSLPLWNSALSSRRHSSPVIVGGNVSRRSTGVPAKKVIRPTIQVFDCRNITLEGVEAAQTRCSSLTIRSYYSWSHPSTSAPTTSSAYGGSGATEGIDGEGGEEEDDDVDDNVDGDMNGSQTSLHHLQLQQQHLQQLQHQNRASNLLRRVRHGLIGRNGGGQDAVQCTIL